VFVDFSVGLGNFHNGNMVYQAPSSGLMYTATPHPGMPGGMLFAVKAEGKCLVVFYENECWCCGKVRGSV
jgi:hypothetical protein